MRCLAFITFILIALTNAVSQPLAQRADPDLEVVRQRFVSELLASSSDSIQVHNLMISIKEDGSWPDIDYEDVSNTAFEHSRHLQNMIELSRAYAKSIHPDKKPGPTLHGDPKLKVVIFSALDFWLDHDFICDNWWWNQIGTPDRLVNVLLMMDNELTQTQKKRAAPIVIRANLNAWGARPGGDRIQIAGILGKYGLFIRNVDTLQKVVNTMAEEIRFAADRGIPSDRRGLQTDLSFHHRNDRVTSTLSYGLGYANSFAAWAAKLAGTKFRFPEKAIELLVDFYLDGICKTMVHGKYPDPGAKNRSITRKGTLHPYDTDLPENLLMATAHRKNELETIIKIRKGEVAHDLTSNKFFWHTEYFSHQRPEYFTSVRMYSTRNHSMEEPYNGEGLKNHHLGDGSNFISRTGEEYTDIFPVYDWQKIPGTTAVQKPGLPYEKEIQKKGLTDFVGGVSDGKYGAAAFDFKSPHDNLACRKAWFMFDEEYVCIGTSIHSDEPYPVVTTLNQCYLKEDVTVMQNNNKSVIENGEHVLGNVDWVYHGGTGYFFPSQTVINLSAGTQSGSWHSINRQSQYSAEEISGDVFKLWLDHGVNPRAGQYEYIVIPATSLDKMEGYRERHQIEIVANSPDVQAVTNKGPGITQAVFHRPGEISISDDIDLSISTPGLVMVHTNGPMIRSITVSDPSRKLTSLRLRVTASINATGDNFNATWNKAGGFTDITIDLPVGEFAGSSVTMEITNDNDK